MVEHCERMLRFVKDNPRWPGIQAKKGSPFKETFSEMDMSLNEREVQYWEGRLAHYKKGLRR